MSEPTRKANTIARTGGDLLAEDLEALKGLFPGAFVEGKVDFARLREMLGDAVDERPERYSFAWAGKRDAIRLLQTPSRATLIPAPKESIDFDTTGNIFIEGDNLEVLKLLHKSYAGRVKLIYIDPPYNTGGEFVYPDDFSDPLGTYLKLTGQQDEAGNVLTSNAEASGRYHSAWLSMMYPRLFMARQMLAEDGVIFISIDDHEVHDLRMLMNEVFGEENFVATIIWQKVYSPKNTARHFSEDHDYIVVYARNAATWTPTALPRTEAANARYENPDNDPRKEWKPSDLTARNYYSEGQYEVTSPSGKTFRPSIGTYWRVKKSKFLELDEDKRIWWGPNGNNMPALKRFLSEVKQGIVPQTLWKYQDVGHTQEGKQQLLEFVQFQNTDNVIDSVKPPRLIQRVLQVATTVDEGDIVLDFFAGTGSSAHAVLNQNHEDGGNRQFIAVQLPEPLPKPETRLKTIADIARERISTVIGRFKDDAEGRLKTDNGNGPEDLGVRCFTLAESCFLPWSGVEDRKPDSYADQMALYADPLVKGWKAEDVIWEVAIKQGYSLSSRIEKDKNLNGNTIWRVIDGERGQSFRICLDDKLTLAVVKKLDLTQGDLFVCRDSALDDTAAANLALQCELRTI